MKKNVFRFISILIFSFSFCSIIFLGTAQAASTSKTAYMHKSTAEQFRHSLSCPNWQEISEGNAYAGNNYLGSVYVDIDTCGHVWAYAAGNNTYVNHLQVLCMVGCSTLDQVLSDSHNGTSYESVDFTPGANRWIAIKGVFQGSAGWGYTLSTSTNGYVYIH